MRHPVPDKCFPVLQCSIAERQNHFIQILTRIFPCFQKFAQFRYPGVIHFPAGKQIRCHINTVLLHFRHKIFQPVQMLIVQIRSRFRTGGDEIVVMMMKADQVYSHPGEIFRQRPEYRFVVTQRILTDIFPPETHRFFRQILIHQPPVRCRNDASIFSRRRIKQK